MAKKNKLYGLEIGLNDVITVPLISLSKKEYFKKLDEVAAEFNKKSIDKQYDEHHFLSSENIIVSNDCYKVTRTHFCVDMCDLYFYEAECAEGKYFIVPLEKAIPHYTG